METIHVWVGSDRWQAEAGAERVLEHTIRKHATCDVDIHWMRSGDVGFEVSPDGADGSWNIGRGPGLAWPKKGWGTDFSAFRFAIPELMNFQGRAVYMDVDMLVLDDVAELLLVPLKRPWVCCHPAITDVSVIDCSAFRALRDRGEWMSLPNMKKSGLRVFEHCQMMARLGIVSDSLSWDWNCRDSNDDWKDSTKLLHYTAVPWQPWHPYETVKYTPHPKVSWTSRWFAEKDEADASAA